MKLFYLDCAFPRDFPKRVPAPSVPPQPLWGMGSKLYGGRYTPKNSFETIYLAEDMVTALTEVVAIVTGLSGRGITLASGPRVIVAVHGVLLSILDLTIAANVQTIGSTYQS
jgi:RES domain-containing protein